MENKISFTKANIEALDLPAAGQRVALWFLAGVKKSKTVKITSEAERLAGCVRQTFAKGLAALEVAGLVAVERKPGQKATVEII